MECNSSIVFLITTQKCKQIPLRLSPSNFKQQFSEFIRLNNISEDEAFEVKSLIQCQLIQSKQKKHQKPSRIILQTMNQPRRHQDQIQVSEMSSIQNIHEEERAIKIDYEEQISQLDDIQPRDPSFLEKSQLIDVQQQRYQLLHYSLSPENSQRETKHRQSQIHIYQTPNQQKYQKKISQKKTIRQKKTINKKQKRVNNPLNNKPKSPIHSPQNKQIFDRLNTTTTQSFTNKKNKDINRKQQADYAQVQRYLLNSNLRRTSPQTFERLHLSNTQSFKNRYNNETLEKTQIEMDVLQHHKKVPIPIQNLFKHVSGARCEMKEIINRRQRCRKQSVKKEREIRKRIIQQSKSPKNVKQYESPCRSCPKCNPQKFIKPAPYKKNSNKEKYPQKETSEYRSPQLEGMYNDFLKQLN